MTTKDKTTVFEPTGLEIMHYILVFCYNWRKEDFQIAFKNSKLGWDYHWNRLQEKCKDEVNASQAIIEIITNMDGKHQKMLFDYLFETKYPDEISRRREWDKIVQDDLNWEEQ